MRSVNGQKETLRLRWLKVASQAAALGALALAFFIATQEFPEFGRTMRAVDSVLKWVILLAAFVIALGLGWRASFKLNAMIFLIGLGFLLLTMMTASYLFGVSWLDTLAFGSSDAHRTAVGYGVMLGALTASLRCVFLKR